MKRLNFDSQGKLLSIDGMTIKPKADSKFSKRDDDEEEIENNTYDGKLRTSDSLQFLKEELILGNRDDTNYWSLYNSGQRLSPLKFSNGKTQEDIVKETVDLIKSGKKVVFIHGVCGTGKCLGKDTLIFCKPNDKECFGYHKITDILGKQGKIVSVNEEGNLVESAFKNVRKTGIKKLYKLKTRTGREIIVSDNHPFLTITKVGVEWKELKNLSPSSYICLPSKIDLGSKDYLDENKVRVLAHLITEGKLGDKAGSPKYYQDKDKGKEIREDYEQALVQLFPDGKIRNHSQTEITMVFNNMNTSNGTTNKLRLFIREFGLDGKKSKDKFVPSEIFNLPKDKMSLFLRILFSCDGSIYIKKSKAKRTPQIIIEYCSISKRLIYDVSLLLNLLGIQHTITSHSFREEKDYSWRISISNHEQLRKYIDNIGFLGEKQKLALEVYSNLKDHKFSNIDKVPRIIREHLKEKGYCYNELDRYLNYNEIENLRKNIGFKKIIKQKLVDTPCVFKQGKIDFLRRHVKTVNNHIEDKTLSFICNDSVFWDRIKSIEFIKIDECYDLEVPEYHNFIANGIIVHNSAIALNIARVLGKSSIVVPIKSLQRQYEEDYTSKKYVLRKNGAKMKIASITGRENHDSVIEPGLSCADPFLPDTIKITDKNYGKIMEYYKQNPYIKNKLDEVDIKKIKRIAIAPANPYWSPILPKEFEAPLKDARKKKYLGLQGKEFVFYHRKEGCSYYDQYQAYIDADILIFNSAKYKIEVALDRKPYTEVDIIDEADEFLDSFSSQEEINLTRLVTSLKLLNVEGESAREIIDGIAELIKLEERNKSALGINEDTIYKIGDTQIDKVLRLFLKNPEVEVEISLDELNYANKAVEIAKDFVEFLDDTYVTFKRRENDLYVNLVTTNLSSKFHEILDKSKSLVLMSGTLHSESVIRNVFGINDFSIVEAEAYNQGNIEIHRTGKEIDCKYSNFSSGKHTRKDYLLALADCAAKAKKPFLVHVNSFEDLPNESEVNDLRLDIISKEELILQQGKDKSGKRIQEFKSKQRDNLFTTKCSRGVDFPKDMCNSVIFTKYPNPNVNGTFWKILQKTHPSYYWDFYRDKARREFLQRIYRAVRSKDDHVYVLSPDLRVFDAVRDIQKTIGK